MLGPLPTLHRVTVVLSMLVLCGAVGASLGADPAVPFLVGTGLLGGAAVGLAMAIAVLRPWHDPHGPHEPQARVRHRRR